MTSSLSSFSQLSSLPSSSISDSQDLDELLERITGAKAAIRHLTQELERDLDLLDQMVQAGYAEDCQAWNDYTITRRTRKTYTYPDHITQQREALKASERLSVALGEATLKTTTFWEVRAPKEPQP